VYCSLVSWLLAKHLYVVESCTVARFHTCLRLRFLIFVGVTLSLEPAILWFMLFGFCPEPEVLWVTVFVYIVCKLVRICM